MYGNSGNIDAASEVFRRMNSLETVPWNAMITAFAHNGHYKEALALLWEMQLESVFASSSTYVTVLNACTCLAEGIRVHQRILESGFETDVITATALLNMYGKFGSLEHAREMFDKMEEKNVVTWNGMVTMYSNKERFKEAFHIFREMQLEGMKPSEATFLTALAACGSLAMAVEGRLVHGFAVESGFFRIIHVATAVVDMYGKIGSLSDALAVFEGVESKDVVLWNSLIAACAQAGHSKEALQLFHRMQTEGVTPDYVSLITLLGACCAPEALADGKLIHARICKNGLEEDVRMGTALVNMYGKTGSVEDARAIFNRMKNRSLVTWNAMIAAYAQQEDGANALRVFQQMLLEGIKADRVTFVSILSACVGLSNLVTGKKIHSYILENGLSLDAVLENALLTMYSKTGGLEHARQVFEEIGARDTASWNTIITTLAHHGDGSGALKLFYRMQQLGVKPKIITFMSVLSACSHAGFLWQGLECFSSMVHDHGLEASEEHYGCVIDLLGRAGRLKDAEEFIRRMPVAANSVIWMSLLGACNVQGDMNRAKNAAERVLELNPQNDAAYVVLSNMKQEESTGTAGGIL